jgi:hypothetical protein
MQLRGSGASRADSASSLHTAGKSLAMPGAAEVIQRLQHAGVSELVQPPRRAFAVAGGREPRLVISYHSKFSMAEAASRPYDRACANCSDSCGWNGC